MLFAACNANQPALTSTPTAGLNAQPFTKITLIRPSATYLVKATTTPKPDFPIATPVTPNTISLPTSPTSPISPTSSPPEPTITDGPLDWKTLPVIPEVPEQIKLIYQKGLDIGNNPHAFSKIGDCGSTPAWFLGDFDRGEKYYKLGPNQELSGVIQQFQGSYDRTSLAARAGFNASSLFVPLWSDRTFCQPDETPLACEYRVNRPVIAFIMLGSNDVWHPDEFEPQMRKIIEFSIHNGVIPILSSKADNAEGDGAINATIARLAQEYHLPLWNFWRAVQDLPDHGLQEDKVHLTWGRNLFDDSQEMSKAWPTRNLTALQTLNAVWQTISSQNN